MNFLLPRSSTLNLWQFLNSLGTQILWETKASLSLWENCRLTSISVSAQFCRKLLSGLGVTTRPYCKEKHSLLLGNTREWEMGGWGDALFPAWDLIGQDVLPEVDHLASLVGTTFSWNLLVWKKKNHRPYKSFHQIKEDVAANLSMNSGPWTAIT
jgi:hypothetical protein